LTHLPVKHGRHYVRNWRRGSLSLLHPEFKWTARPTKEQAFTPSYSSASAVAVGKLTQGQHFGGEPRGGTGILQPAGAPIVRYRSP